jgi:hypothetical protein
MKTILLTEGFYSGYLPGGTCPVTLEERDLHQGGVLGDGEGGGSGDEEKRKFFQETVD